MIEFYEERTYIIRDGYWSAVIFWILDRNVVELLA